MKPKLPLVMDLNTLGQMAQLNEQKRLRKELEEQNEIARRTARASQAASQTASQPASIPHDPDKAGKCCACNNIVSFEALTCPDCGQPDPSQHARGTAPSEEFERDHRQANFIYKPPSPDDVGGIEPSAEAGFWQDEITHWVVWRDEWRDEDGNFVPPVPLPIVLDLHDNQLTDVKGLEKLDQLTNLYLDRNQLSDVKGLEKLTQLTDLSLGGNKLTNLPQGLEKLTRLTLLWLNNNQLTDVTPLKDLTQLTSLHLSDNQLIDVTALKDLTQLTSLWLEDNQLTDVTALKDLTQLTVLSLHDNKLTDVKGLEKLPQLVYLDLKDNPDLTKAQIDELQKALPNCNIESNPTK